MGLRGFVAARLYEVRNACSWTEEAASSTPAHGDSPWCSGNECRRHLRKERLTSSISVSLSLARSDDVDCRREGGLIQKEVTTEEHKGSASCHEHNQRLTSQSGFGVVFLSFGEVEGSEQERSELDDVPPRWCMDNQHKVMTRDCVRSAGLRPPSVSKLRVLETGSWLQSDAPCGAVWHFRRPLFAVGSEWRDQGQLHRCAQHPFHTEKNSSPDGEAAGAAGDEVAVAAAGIHAAEAPGHGARAAGGRQELSTAPFFRCTSCPITRTCGSRLSAADDRAQFCMNPTPRCPHRRTMCCPR